MKVLLQLASRDILFPSTTATATQSSTVPATGMPDAYVGAVAVPAIIAIAAIALRRGKKERPAT